MRKRVLICLGILLLGICVTTAVFLPKIADNGLVVDFGHYLGRDSMPGEHKEEAKKLRTGLNKHTRTVFFTESGMNQGNLIKQSALLGYDIYRVCLSPAFDKGAAFSFIYDKMHEQGWITFYRNPGAMGHYHQEDHPVLLHDYKRLTKKETELWKQQFEEKFPKIMQEDLTRGGADGMIVTGEYILNGYYEKVHVWCPNQENNPIFSEIIDQFMQSFDEPCEELRPYLY